ncbi:MAG TPA: ImmA/IrrE family metallo-endopeptidase [Candidatus Jeotgalibaca merdavium]|uniref:ImmA/IrrE family metallo-endopeptidase n=1 Tax=Candidatus Jeotgalibaca merdavium TaxID=2838627 RepID=A0A9D2I3K6_9LACT|nr:ImmA/IrrE family metallo-endopeptidase [Candidatus Jeotgalibaca merdavium]
MQKLEKLIAKVPEVNITFDQYMPRNLKGLYFDNNIRLNSKNDYYQNVVVLAEEIGHHYTSYGHIHDYSQVTNMQQEHRARRFAIKLLLPLEKIIECYEMNVWGDKYEICSYLEITPNFFEEAVSDYIKKFGQYVKYDGYKISFEPLNIEKI